MLRSSSAFKTAMASALVGIALAAQAFAGVRTTDIAVAVRLVQELYVEPLQLNDSWLSVETEPFGASCNLMAVTVRLTSAHAPRDQTVLLVVHFQFVNGHLEYMSTEGPARERSAGTDGVKRAVRIFGREFGWSGSKSLPNSQRPDREYVSLGPTSVVFDAETHNVVGIGYPAAPCLDREE